MKQEINPEDVVIVAPFGATTKAKSIYVWYNFIRNFYPKNQIILSINSARKRDIVETHLILSQKFKHDKNLTMWLDDKNAHEETTKKAFKVINDREYFERICSSRNICLETAKKLNAPAVLWLDTDTIPLIKDPIERLLSHNVDIVSGLYMYKKTIVPVVINPETKKNFTFEEMRPAVETNKLLEAYGFGFGCVLVRSDLFSYKFSHTADLGEDLHFCEQLRKDNIKLHFDPLVVCNHLTEEDAEKILNVENEK